MPRKKGGEYVTCYFCLSRDLAGKLRQASYNIGTTESAALRGMLDRYFQKPPDRSYRPLEKHAQLGVRTTPRTIRRDQDRRLRQLSAKTGKSVSEIIRQAIEESA